ncbi:DUF4105 domain-containing protein [Pseudoxanthomonas daejeonensis]|uniref:DUF4105 domain-containing protein n=1 Tax=Pseudoxanthomonas daejeonensis TaxID=266062 RepID=A0ABQ6ZAH8_9GAMM|nr:DUF4105 domain-containing protein [Pseudoxanthomonas daejeonensis]KAF1696364.1 hypothetical protein CSC65_03875 [Pseudoxanthomonas daejeonensis]UNK57036.1 DUF4105 domain-containing protein [Pseudoxanthomonas daejeonensis]
MNRIFLAFAAALLWLGGGHATANAQAFTIADEIPPAERAATLQLLGQGLRMLPPSWSMALDRPIAFTWRDDLPDGVHGRARHWSIALDRRLLAAWMAHRPDTGNDDPATRAALAALLHELAHLYDRTPAGGLSRDPRLLDLAGWQVAAVMPGRRARNDFRDRTPDPYEATSPKEYVAVNLEHYLLDPDYACRRPALAAHFDAHFGTQPSSTASCADGLLFVGDDLRSADPQRLLDPGRIFEVDYLLADANERPMSRWGHSMLRLVVCAPGRPRGPDCRLDLQHHLVLSFRAFVGDVQISSWRGLTGSYPSRLFALPLGQVIDEYTRVELRGLRSVPLALSRQEIGALAGRAAQLHWNYDGHYYFVSNNCAVETWKLLHDALPRLAALPLSSIRPNGLLARLREAGVTAEAGIPTDAAGQVRLGYYFEPASAHYQAMYAVARDELGLQAVDAGDWLALPPQARAPALRRAGLKSAAALLVLESAALRQQEALARDELKRRWLGDARSVDAAGDIAAPLREFLRLGSAFSRPASWLQGVPGYGLPQADEREVLGGRIRADAASRVEQVEALEAAVRQLLPPAQREVLEDTGDNVVLIGERLRALAAGS